VDDFVGNLNPNQLDYNLNMQTMKLKTDYLLLIRKLFGYRMHWGILENEERRFAANEEQRAVVHVLIPEEQRTVVHMLIPEDPKCSLNINIKHAFNIKNPNKDIKAPNTYVCFRNPFRTNGVELRTPVVYMSTLPQWNYEHALEGVSISEISTYLLSNQLEFEVFHKRLPDEIYHNEQESVLIGRAYMDASNLIKDPMNLTVSGYYHIYTNEKDRHIDDYQMTNTITQGQIHIEISVNKPLVGEFDILDRENRQFQGVMKGIYNQQEKQLSKKTDDNIIELERAIRKAKELRKVHKRRQYETPLHRSARVSMSPVREQRYRK
jgi:ribosomal protein S21